MQKLLGSLCHLRSRRSCILVVLITAKSALVHRCRNCLKIVVPGSACSTACENSGFPQKKLPHFTDKLECFRPAKIVVLTMVAYHISWSPAALATACENSGFRHGGLPHFVVPGSACPTACENSGFIINHGGLPHFVVPGSACHGLRK